MADVAGSVQSAWSSATGALKAGAIPVAILTGIGIFAAASPAAAFAGVAAPVANGFSATASAIGSLAGTASTTVAGASTAAATGTAAAATEVVSQFAFEGGTP